jgi:muramoyltetrapeptide carboxypeptidase LdcA involved in peptidoglycan recycling
MTTFELYLFTKLDLLQAILGTISILSGLVFVAIYVIGRVEEEDKLIKMSKKFLIGFSISTTLVVAIPNTKDMAIIYSLHYLTNNEDAKKIPDNVLKFINQELEEELTDKK